ncbi:MAG: hypothetical protein O3C10_00695 [Chloroflexi bacterium]|nr:hypothetical protein [Chloroflexota bacterium]
MVAAGRPVRRSGWLKTVGLMIVVATLVSCGGSSERTADEQTDTGSAAATSTAVPAATGNDTAAASIGDQANPIGIPTEDVVNALARNGVWPQGVWPSLEVVLANSAFYAAFGEPVPAEYQGTPSLLFIVNEDSHDDLGADPPSPILRIDGGEGHTPMSVEVQTFSFHHRTSLVRYGLTGAGGEPIFGEKTRLIEMVFSGEGDASTDLNELRWELPIAFADGIASRDVTLGTEPGADSIVSLVRVGSRYEGELEAAIASVNSDATVIVELTDAGATPDELRIPYGQRVALVMRNTGVQEHHFHIMDLETDVLHWYAKSGTVVAGEPLTEAGAAAYVTAAEDADVDMDMDTGMDMTSHAAADGDGMNFVSSGELVGHHICVSESGICPTGDWVHAHANPGDWDLILFVPADRGTFEVQDPLHPDISAQVVVY